MTEYEPGVPQQPVLWTLDGDEFLVIRARDKMEKGVPHIEITMSPMKWVVAKENIDKADLDFSDETGDAYGALHRTYPASYIITLSNNPEKPVWLLMTSWSGDKINWDKPELFPLLEIVQKLDAKDKLISRQRQRVSSLEDENAELMSKFRIWMNKTRKIMGEQQYKMIEKEVGGIEVPKA